MPGRWRTAWKALKRKKLSLAGASIAALFVLVSASATMLSPYDPNAIDLAKTLAPPGPGHWLGTDNQGRDLFSRMIFGARVSLYVGIGSITLGAGFGVASGLLAGYYRSLNGAIMRVMDILLAFPGIIVALTVIAVLGPGLNNVVLAVGLSQIPQFARVVHGLALIVGETTYVESARSLGASDAVIVGRHILPNVLSPVIVQASLLFPDAILTGASLSFLGAGVQPPTAEWGAMLSDSRQWMQVAPHLMIVPGTALMLVVLGFNVFGDGLRDILDPRVRSKQRGATRT
jgi:peptide/nickel transport system permease protein